MSEYRYYLPQDVQEISEYEYYFPSDAGSENPKANDNITLNEMLIPSNLELEPSADFYARKIRFCTKTDPAHVYELHWATYEDSTRSSTTIVLYIEIFHYATIRRKQLPGVFLDTYLRDAKIVIAAMLSSEFDGEAARTKMWVPGEVPFGKALEAAAKDMWTD